MNLSRALIPEYFQEGGGGMDWGIPFNKFN